jgi:nucleoside-diphosphate-sugar epimerase
MEAPRYLITGGGGFIGSHLVRGVLGRGHPVRVLDNFSSGSRQNLAGVQGDLEIVEGDIRDSRTCAAAVRDCAFVLHHAALPSVVRSVSDPQSCHDVNINGTFNLLLASRDAGVRRFVYACSSSVYGESPELPKEESMRPTPLSPYAVTKLTGEYYCGIFHSLYGLQTVSLRYFNVFGPRQDPTSQYSAVIPRFITAILRGESPTVYGDGGQTRDFTYVANVLHANMLACTRPDVGGLAVNVGAGQRYSLLELIRELERLAGRQAKPVFEPTRPGDVRDSLADIARAREKLGYEPIVDFGTGLRETLAYFKDLV